MIVVAVDGAWARAAQVAGGRIRRWARIRLDGPAACPQGVVQDPDAVAARYRRVLAAIGVTRAAGVLLVPETLAVGDRVTVPRGLPRRAVPTAVRALAVKQLGGGGDHLTVRWRIVQTHPQVAAFAVGALTAAVAAHVAAWAAAGLTVTAVELRLVAWARLGRGSGPAIWAWLGDDGADSACVLLGGQPAQVYSRPAAPGDPARQVGWLAEAADEVARRAGLPPAVWLGGPRATPADVAWLRQAGWAAGPGPVPPGGPADVAPCGGAGRRGVVLDLHPAPIPPAVRAAPRRIVGSLALSALVAAGDLAWDAGHYAPTLAALQARATAAQVAVTSNAAAVAARTYVADAAALAHWRQVLQGLAGATFPWARVVPALLQAAGPGVTLTQVSASTGSGGTATLTVTGTAASIGALTAFSHRLPAGFGPLTVSQLTAETGGWQFAATLPVTLPAPAG